MGASRTLSSQFGKWQKNNAITDGILRSTKEVESLIVEEAIQRMKVIHRLLLSRTKARSQCSIYSTILITRYMSSEAFAVLKEALSNCEKRRLHVIHVTSGLTVKLFGFLCGVYLHTWRPLFH